MKIHPTKGDGIAGEFTLCIQVTYFDNFNIAHVLFKSQIYDENTGLRHHKDQIKPLNIPLLHLNNQSPPQFWPQMA